MSMPRPERVPSWQNGNITELLLKEGFARCVDWSIAVYTRGADKLRAAERLVRHREPRGWGGHGVLGSLQPPIPVWVPPVLSAWEEDAICP